MIVTVAQTQEASCNMEVEAVDFVEKTIYHSRRRRDIRLGRAMAVTQRNPLLRF